MSRLVLLWNKIKSFVAYVKLGVDIQKTKDECIIELENALKLSKDSEERLKLISEKLAEEIRHQNDEWEKVRVLELEKNFWDTKWKKSPITYKGKDYDNDVRNYCYSKSYIIEPVVWALVKKEDEELKKVRKLLTWASTHITYVSDQNNKGRSEYWQDAEETISSLKGDCEDGSILFYSMLRIAGIPDYKVKLCAGLAEDAFNKGNIVGHCYLLYLYKDDWCTIDWCYYPNESLERLGVKSHRFAERYKEIWFTWNESWSWSGKDVDLTGRIKNTNSNSRRMK